ncbi:hypothetical protein PoMZ_02694 [Pyricularia oryzae]|uniref:Uncharacterized protein n=1 Tax=Pyricularia oryzae TaxID=318829 RepID=A0A4P7N5D6_PYROR|nr:hypothetical protein PoMZ_02694 [Pyricularia oryzae]
MESKTQGQRGRQAYYSNNNFLLKMSGLGCWWPGGVRLGRLLTGTVALRFTCCIGRRT